MTVKHWIGGAEDATDDGGWIPLDNPATGERIGEVARADAGVVDRAVVVATRAQRSWAATSLARRTEILFRMRELVVQHADELARLISTE